MIIWQVRVRGFEKKITLPLIFWYDSVNTVSSLNISLIGPISNNKATNKRPKYKIEFAMACTGILVSIILNLFGY
jgi:hypothetical protein